MERLKRFICERLMEKSTKKRQPVELEKEQPRPESPNEFYRQVTKRPTIRELLERLAKK